MLQGVSLSESAKQQLENMNINLPNFLRLWVAEGGCSGMTYQAAIDETVTPFDKVLFEDGNLRIVSDGESALYFQGVFIDYSNDLVKSGFRFHNPNAVKSCGCGSSFQA